MNNGKGNKARGTLSQVGPWPWDDVGDLVGAQASKAVSPKVGEAEPWAHRFSRRLHGRREGRKESRKDVRSLMKKSVRNSRRGLAHSWWVVLGLVVLLTACTVEESDGPVESDEL